MKRIGLVLALMMTAPAHAATPEGYMTSGGVGGIRCAVYSNALAEARQAGLQSYKGASAMNEFVQYAYGFFTGYNSVADGIFDILGGIRDDQMHITVLSMADTYCAANPTDTFDGALVDVLKKIFPTALTTRP
jgi:hypothetical protein